MGMIREFFTEFPEVHPVGDYDLTPEQWARIAARTIPQRAMPSWPMVAELLRQRDPLTAA